MATRWARRICFFQCNWRAAVAGRADLNHAHQVFRRAAVRFAATLVWTVVISMVAPGVLARRGDSLPRRPQ